MNVLVVEDTDEEREILVYWITKWGFTPMEAQDGETAWALLNDESSPGIAILDWGLPGISGVELIKMLANRPAGAPLVYAIMLTSRSEQEDRIEALQSGAFDFLTKPVDPDELRSRLAVGKRLVESEKALRNAKSEICTLQGILPICMHCKRIRDDTGFWTQIEAYLENHAVSVDMDQLCPECIAQHNPPSEQ